LLEHDPSTGPAIEAFGHEFDVSSEDRHSHISMGPRFRRFSPEALYGEVDF